VDITSCLLFYHIRARERANARRHTRARARARFRTHVREPRGAGARARARARVRTHTDTRADLHVVHAGRLRVGLATGVELISNVHSRFSFSSSRIFPNGTFRRRERLDLSHTRMRMRVSSARSRTRGSNVEFLDFICIRILGSRSFRNRARNVYRVQSSISINRPSFQLIRQISRIPDIVILGFARIVPIAITLTIFFFFFFFSHTYAMNPK